MALVKLKKGMEQVPAWPTVSLSVGWITDKHTWDFSVEYKPKALQSSQFPIYKLISTYDYLTITLIYQYFCFT
jgi:hypothetical protein